LVRKGAGDVFAKKFDEFHKLAKDYTIEEWEKEFYRVTNELLPQPTEKLVKHGILTTEEEIQEHRERRRKLVEDKTWDSLYTDEDFEGVEITEYTPEEMEEIMKEANETQKLMRETLAKYENE